MKAWATDLFKWWGTLTPYQKTTTYLLAGSIVSISLAMIALKQTRSTMRERQQLCDERVKTLEHENKELTNYILFDTKNKERLEDSIKTIQE